jgi:hypothetical protein
LLLFLTVLLLMYLLFPAVVGTLAFAGVTALLSLESKLFLAFLLLMASLLLKLVSDKVHTLAEVNAHFACVSAVASATAAFPAVTGVTAVGDVPSAGGVMLYSFLLLWHPCH